MNFPKWVRAKPSLSKTLVVVVVIILISISFVLGMKNQAFKFQSIKNLNQDKKNIASDNSDNNKVDEDFMQLEYFNKTVLPNLPALSEEIKDSIIRRVTYVEDRSWLVETFDSIHSYTGYKPNLQETRSTVESRNQYLVRDGGFLKKLTEEPILCYIEKSKIVRHDNNISINTPLKEDMLLVSGACNRGKYFVSLYKYSTGEKIKFSDPNNLIRAPKSDTIDSQGNVLGYSDLITYGIEPIISVDFVHTDSYEPPQEKDPINPSWGLAIFSVRTGKLLDLTDFNTY